MNPLDVVEVRVNWERVAASPWAGCRLVGRVLSADGQEHEVPHQEANALAMALRAAGARLVESVDGLGRVVRITNYELRITNEEAGETPAIQTVANQPPANQTAANQPAAIQPPAVRPRPGSVGEALAEMVALGKANQPGLGKRLEAAASLVGDGLVAMEETEARVGPYRISAEGCTCGDFRHRGGWCKHRLAVRMARHLVGNGFVLPQRVVVELCLQIRPGDLAKISSGQVVDEARRRERAYRESGHGARDRAMRMLGNGAGSLPAELARKAGVTSYEIRDTSEEARRVTSDERRVTSGEGGHD